MAASSLQRLQNQPQRELGICNLALVGFLLSFVDSTVVLWDHEVNPSEGHMAQTIHEAVSMTQHSL